MILQALHEYYQRNAADPESGIAPPGFEWKEIPFVIVIDLKGKFVTLEDTREGDGNRRRARPVLVPQGEKKTVGIKANLLWDDVEYAVGANPRGRNDISQRHATFVNRLRSELPSRETEPRVHALLKFLEADPVAQIQGDAASAAMWSAALETKANVTFRIDGSAVSTLCDEMRPHLLPRVHVDADESVCLVLAKKAPISRIHPAIKGVRDAQSSGASLVSFNLAAFNSYGREQNHNAPISEDATFSYTTALNTLLRRDSANKMQVGDATTVFWSEKKTEFEDHFIGFFAMPPKDDPDRDVRSVRALYESVHKGSAVTDTETRFYVLGLAPNAARIAVRFWHHGTVADLSHRIREHFDDLEIERGAKDVGRYALFWLLVEIASERKVDNVPPNLAGEIVRAILSGAPYPRTLPQQTLRRIRADRVVTRMRAAILKASLNRFQRLHPTEHKEITVALDPTNTSPGYRLGRLFAALEKIQEDAQPGINATIRDRYYGAASSNPVTVFPQLLKLKNHHLAKLENVAFRITHEKRLTEIIGGLDADMPAHLPMDEQARFAIGYYHQRQAFFTKSIPNETPAS